MCDMKALSETADVEFEKCGEIIVAPKRGVFALSCFNCQDIFMQLPEFMRHVRSSHYDALEFTKFKNAAAVYTIEELLSARAPKEASEDEDYLWKSGAEESEMEDDASGDELGAAEIPNDTGTADDLNLSIWKALEECDVVPKLRADVETKTPTPRNKQTTKRVAEEKPNADNFNMTAFLADLETNDLTEISLEQLRDMNTLPQSKRPRVEEAQKSIETKYIQKGPLKTKVKALEAGNFNVKNLEKGHFINKMQLEESKNQEKLVDNKSITAKNETKITKTKKSPLKSKSNELKGNAFQKEHSKSMLDFAVSGKNQKNNVQESEKPNEIPNTQSKTIKSQTKIQAYYKSTTKSDIINLEKDASKVSNLNISKGKNISMKESEKQETVKPANSSKAINNETEEVRTKRFQKSKFKNLFSALDDDCLELDNILDSLETSDTEINVGKLEPAVQDSRDEEGSAVEQVSQETTMAEEEEAAVDADFHETTIAAGDITQAIQIDILDLLDTTKIGELETALEHKPDEEEDFQETPISAEVEKADVGEDLLATTMAEEEGHVMEEAVKIEQSNKKAHSSGNLLQNENKSLNLGSQINKQVNPKAEMKNTLIVKQTVKPKQNTRVAQAEFKVNIENTSILKQTVDSKQNQPILEVDENLKNSPEQRKTSAPLAQLRRTPRRAPKYNKNKENSENREPVNDEKKLKSVMVKVQRLSPEVIAQTEHDKPKPNAKTPLKSSENDKKSFQAAVDANRLKNPHILQALLSESYENEADDFAEDDEKPKSDTSTDNDAASRLTKSDKTPKQTTCDRKAQSNRASAEFVQQFKLPAGLKMTKVSTPTETAMPITTETPIKATFVKQNFTEANASELEALKNSTFSAKFQKPLEVDDAKKPKPEPPTSASTRLRQRKASIDIVSSEVATKTPRSNLDAKSYAVNRSARKNDVLKRMRSIKKQIFRSIGVKHDVGVKVDKQNLLKVIAEGAAVAQNHVKSAPQKIQIEKVETLPNFNLRTIKKEEVKLTPQLMLKQRNSSQNFYKKNIEKDEKSPPQLLQKRRPSSDNAIFAVKSNEEKLSPQLPPKRRPSSDNVKSIAKTIIKKEEKLTPRVLPKRRPSSDNANSSAFNDFKKPKIEVPKRAVEPYSRIAPLPKRPKTEQSTPKSLVASPLEVANMELPNSVAEFLEPKIVVPKRAVEPYNRIAPLPKRLKTELSTPKSLIASKLELANNELPNSVAEYLEHDLNSNGLHDKHSTSVLDEAACEERLLNASAKMQLNYSANDSNESLTIDNLMDQVISESTTSSDTHSVDEYEIPEMEANENQSGDKTKLPLSAADQEDLNLLEQVGLMVIKTSEESLPLEQYESNQVRAHQFALLFEQTSFIWHSRTSELKVPEKLNEAFAHLTESTNEAFGLQLTEKDLKRLSNLLIIWYTTQCNSKLIGKQAVPTRVEQYLRLFSFIPKTMRRMLICEYCGEQFRSEVKYTKHRIEHTGAMPFVCRHCSQGFMRPGPLHTHELKCKNKCNVCAQKFSSAEELDEHSRLKHQYKCVKCDAQVTSAQALKLHMRECGSRSTSTSAHILKMYQQECVKQHKCGVCRASFASAAMLYTHSQTHLQKVHKCRICPRVFAADQDLQRHMLLCCKREEQSATPRPSYARTKRTISNTESS